MTEEQFKSIREVKDRYTLPSTFIFDFEKRWNEVVWMLKKSKTDLAKINIVEEIKKGK